MKRFWIWSVPLTVLLAAGVWALAQAQPPRPDGGPRDRAQRPYGPGPGPGDFDRGGPGGPGGPGGRGEFGEDGPRHRPPPPELDRLRGYLDAVDAFSRLTKDNDSAGVAAVIAANDVLRPRGPEALIKYFEQMLPRASSPAVQRAIRMQLFQAYHAMGEQDKALAQLEPLITGSNNLGSEPSGATTRP